MPRVIEEQVRHVLPQGTTLTSDQILAAISASTLIVNRVAARYTFNEAELIEIERYLSAHACAVAENSLSVRSEEDGCSDSKITYGFRFGNGVLGTPFGQMANTISGGVLTQLDKKPIGFKSVGTIEYIQT